jgi:hypothetical protein
MVERESNAREESSPVTPPSNELNQWQEMVVYLAPRNKLRPGPFAKEVDWGREGGTLSLFLTRFFFSFTRRHGSLFCCYFLSRVNFYRTAAVFHARTKTPYFAQGV